MTLPDGGAARVGVALLVVGYPVSIAVLVRLMPVLRQRRRGWFALLMAGMSCLVVGFLLLRRPVPVAINGAGLVALGASWRWRGRRHE